jgi:hypothetical protein
MRTLPAVRLLVPASLIPVIAPAFAMIPGTWVPIALPVGPICHASAKTRLCSAVDRGVGSVIVQPKLFAAALPPSQSLAVLTSRIAEVAAIWPIGRSRSHLGCVSPARGIARSRKSSAQSWSR